MPLSPSTPLGAFTNLTVAAINAALVQAGLAGTTGNVFYCDPVNGLNTNNGQRRQRFPAATARYKHSVRATTFCVRASTTC